MPAKSNPISLNFLTAESNLCRRFLTAERHPTSIDRPSQVRAFDAPSLERSGILT
eukprot:GDKH01012881.1.p3 GENE.GDKH01012881.1~~GDKH01012881.1.p3  ORF type:complete len:55 (+),score=5.83 GDKH01012881.1:207-371(+)